MHESLQFDDEYNNASHFSILKMMKKTFYQLNIKDYQFGFSTVKIYFYSCPPGDIRREKQILKR